VPRKPEISIDDYTKKEIMALLDEKGVEYDIMKRKAELFEQLKEVI
jgi:hypothetical protein